jgi:D-xylose transport system permease protein
MESRESTTEAYEQDAGRLAATEEDATLAPVADIAVVAPDVLAESLGDYLRAWWKRMRGGESGTLPILAGLIIIVVFFQLERSEFLSALNIVNLLTQATVFILFAAVEIFALVLSEVDLSAGYVAAVGGFIIAELIAAPVNLPWWIAIIAALAATGAIGALQGSLIARLGLPSFVVTLGGLLGWQGVMLILAEADSAAVGGVISISPSSPVYKLVNSNMSPALGWIALAVVVAGYTVLSITRDARRRAQGLTVPPISITIMRIVVAAAGGIALVVICNLNRGLLVPLKGVPWVVPFVGAVLLAWSILLGRTRVGRYIYAIGANPEAARRAGIDVALVRTLGFTLCGITACLAGLVYESRLGSMATNIDGGTLVLFGVAAAVIGGASLFGGRGKPLHALLGGIIVATVYNGLGLMGISAAGQDIATAVVLIAAVSVDALVRRRGATGAV